MRWLPASLALLCIAALPLVADRLRTREERCVGDGVLVAPDFRVRVIDADGARVPFCGVRCARRWLAVQEAAPRAILVTDSATGRELDARTAWFVRTYSTGGASVPDPIRVFASKNEAVRYAGAYGGEVLSDPPLGRDTEEGNALADG